MPVRLNSNGEMYDLFDYIHNTTNLPMSGNLNYDGRPANGLEIDIYEHEYETRLSSGRELTNTMFMKAINGEKPVGAGYTAYCSGSTTLAAPGETLNNTLSAQYGAWSTNDVIDRDAHIHVGSAFPTGPISTGYHKIGFYYGQDELVWYIDGYPVQVEDCLVPDTDMYLVLSREMNTGLTLDNAAIDNKPGAIFNKNTSSDPVRHKEIFIDGGLWGGGLGAESNLSQLGQVVKDANGVVVQSDLSSYEGKDYVPIKSVRVWSVDGGNNGVLTGQKR